MNRKATTLRALTDYFLEKGEILSYHDYVRQDDVPMPPRTIKRLLGAWGRLPRMIKVNHPEDFDKIMGNEPKVDTEAIIAAEIEAEEQAKKDAAEKLAEVKKLAAAKVAALKAKTEDKNEK